MKGTREDLTVPQIAMVTEAVLGSTVTDVIVSGDCPTGVDALVKKVAKRKRTFVECHAAWDTHGHGGGPIRNGVIAEYADMVIAFPKGPSKGTRGCIALFLMAGKTVKVIEL